MGRKLRVAIECRVADPRQGVGTAMLALAKALSNSQEIEHEYTFVVQEPTRDWLLPYIYGPCKLAAVPQQKGSTLTRVARRIPPLRPLWHRYCDWVSYAPKSDGFVEAGKFDVVHFVTQTGYLTDVPSIYQPHDLQHLHYPQFFSKADFARRERLYRIFCDQASYVCVHAEWTRQDVIKQYALPGEKVVVIPWGCVFDAYETPSEEKVSATVNKYNLPTPFFFFPAVTWPHKNHEVIFRAVQLLKREHGLTPHVVFTGSSTDFRLTLDKLAAQLEVSEQMHFLGFLSPDELQAIYKAAIGMIYPSKFEGFGLPILEAFQARLPVLCSNATVLPEVGQEGALYFEPNEPSQLASLMMTILKEPALRQDLVSRGSSVLSRYTFSETAAQFQALYERTAAANFEPGVSTQTALNKTT